MDPHPAPCGGHGGTDEADASGEEVSTAVVEIGGSGTGNDAGEEAGGKSAALGGNSAAAATPVRKIRQQWHKLLQSHMVALAPFPSSAGWAPPGALNQIHGAGSRPGAARSSQPARLCAVREGKGGVAIRQEGWRAPGARGGKESVTTREGSRSHVPGARHRSG